MCYVKNQTTKLHLGHYAKRFWNKVLKLLQNYIFFKKFIFINTSELFQYYFKCIGFLGIRSNFYGLQLLKPLAKRNDWVSIGDFMSKHKF